MLMQKMCEHKFSPFSSKFIIENIPHERPFFHPVTSSMKYFTIYSILSDSIHLILSAQGNDIPVNHRSTCCEVAQKLRVINTIFYDPG